MLVGTDKGVYATIDNGQHWKPMSPATFAPDAATPMRDRQVQSLSIGFTTPVIMAGTQGFGVYNLPVLPITGGTPTLKTKTALKAGTELAVANLDEDNLDLSKRRHMGFFGTKPYFFTYQWYKCTSDQKSSCSSAIPGATAPTYVIPETDALAPNHASLRYAVKVTGSNIVSPVPITVTSEVTDAGVAALPDSSPTPLAGRSLTQNPVGQPYWGSTLTINKGTWRTDGNAQQIFPETFKYFWQRCDGNAANCKPIAGAGGATYTITTEDIGMKVRALISATKNGVGSEIYEVGTTLTVLNRFPANTVKPRILGDAHTGIKLSSSAGGWAGFDMTYERRWLRCEADGLGCNAIAFPAETGSTYTVKPADLGKRLQLEVKAIAKDPNQNRITTVVSEITAVITDPPPPVVDPGPGPGSSNPTPAPSPTPTPNSNPTPSPTPGPGSGQPQPPNQLVLTIATPKKIKAGVDLKAPKTVAGYQKVTYQWLRSGKKIKKATKAKYRLTKADRNKKISCRITLTPVGGGANVVITTTPVKVPKK